MIHQRCMLVDPVRPGISVTGDHEVSKGWGLLVQFGAKFPQQAF